MKKLFGGNKKKEKEGTLVGKTVMVGPFSVRVEAIVGEGGFATIYRCIDGKTGLAYALKHMRLAPDTVDEVKAEAKVMARLKGHPNILRLHAVAFGGPTGAETDGFMLLDFCPLTLLEVMQRNNFALDDFLVYEVFQDVVWAVAHMHKCNPPLAHRDLKAENVLKNGEGRWVICDFGSATSRAQVYDSSADIAAEEDVIRRTTTPAYRAPEMWDLYTRQRIDTAVDVWALGVLLYVLAFGKLPFPGDSKLAILYGNEASGGSNGAGAPPDAPTVPHPHPYPAPMPPQPYPYPQHPHPQAAQAHPGAVARVPVQPQQQPDLLGDACPEPPVTARLQPERAEVARLAAHNAALEGRVRQLEGLVAAQGSALQRLAADLSATSERQVSGSAPYPPIGYEDLT
eukprot:XP_001701059.1 serine/threonine protein kinase 7 [Chlamydomonas reinhardtii]